MAKAKTKKVTIEVSDTNYDNLQELVDRGDTFKDIPELVSWCVFTAFHAADVASYSPKEVEPVSVQINAVVAVPPGSTAKGDIRKSATTIMHRAEMMLPMSIIHASTSVASDRSKRVKEWREAMEKADG